MQHRAGGTGPDAGVDPSQFFGRRSRPRVDRKAYQLCRQVSDTLNFVLSGDTGDDVLRGLYVDSVDPAPDSSRLLVSVAPLDPGDQTPAEVYLTKLIALSGKLRSEVAAAISRRKTPELVFRVIPPPEPLLAEEAEDEHERSDQESE
jgi:ribosome-binding factor A